MGIEINTSQAPHNGEWSWTCVVDDELMGMGTGEKTQDDAVAAAMEKAVGKN